MSKKTLYAFIVSFALLITVIVLNRLTFYSVKEYSYWVDHTREVITTLESISDNFKSAQIYSPASDSGSLKNFYRVYKSDADSVGRQLVHLRRLVGDNQEQVGLVDTLSVMINNQMSALMSMNATDINDDKESWRREALLVIHKKIREGMANENTLLKKRKEELAAYSHLNNLLTTAFAVIAVGIILFTFLSNTFLSRKRKWLEGFLESILNNSQNGIVHYKAVREHGAVVDFKLEFINKPIDYLLGIQSNEVIGKKLSEFPSYVRGSDLMKRYIRVVDTGEPAEFETFYKKIMWKDGSWYRSRNWMTA
jgi:hypothetical protein